MTRSTHNKCRMHRPSYIRYSCTGYSGMPTDCPGCHRISHVHYAKFGLQKGKGVVLDGVLTNEGALTSVLTFTVLVKVIHLSRSSQLKKGQRQSEDSSAKLQECDITWHYHPSSNEDPCWILASRLEIVQARRINRQPMVELKCEVLKDELGRGCPILPQYFCRSIVAENLWRVYQAEKRKT
jgi:hypothetical protein